MFQTDVLVYGGTPGGVAAAISAAHAGRRVILVEPYARVGGMTTNGLSHTDFRTFESLTGFFLRMTERCEAEYRRTDGADSQAVRECMRGTQCEPHVYQKAIDDMIGAEPNITVLTQHHLMGVTLRRSGEDPWMTHLNGAQFASPQGPAVISAHQFIDASYEGDLMALAGVEYALGREAKETYGESLAPDKADDQLQGYNFRMFMTQVPENRVMPAKPPGYDRAQFVEVLPLLEDGRIVRVFGTSKAIFKSQTPHQPHDKYDINDVSKSPVRLSMPGDQNDWVEGHAAVRQRIFDHHMNYELGLLYFLQHDAAVPAKSRDEALTWGLCRDEFAATGYVPEQLYIREARRMQGAYIYTQKDVEAEPGDVRSKLHTESIAAGDYGPNCHGTSHDGPRFGGAHSGEFYQNVAPYQIPYGVIVPKKCENLLVPVAASSSHVGLCTLRYEPIWSSLGEAAGLAAHLAMQEKIPVQRVKVPALQALLHAEGSATIYISDVPPSSPDFAMTQWWGTLGGFHHLVPPTSPYGTRGKNIAGQYYEAFPFHEAKLDAALDDATRKLWIAIAEQMYMDVKPLQKAATRRDFIAAAYAQKR
ncbi:MAG: FAD-dependent oxidoreductase [Planctomycetes bacterium]|nr:FAD-dependent oxidoreductase [Planctomycetota bacterium]